MSKKMVRMCGSCHSVRGYSPRSINQGPMLPYAGLTWTGEVIPNKTPAAKCDCGSSNLLIMRPNA